jgi:hypothetical protein
MAGRRRFKKIGDCRRYLASILNRIEAEELDPQVASKCAYITNVLASLIRDGELEARITKLEQEINNK